jgi:hypothetical protein
VSILEEPELGRLIREVVQDRRDHGDPAQDANLPENLLAPSDLLTEDGAEKTL